MHRLWQWVLIACLGLSQCKLYSKTHTWIFQCVETRAYCYAQDLTSEWWLYWCRCCGYCEMCVCICACELEAHFWSKKQLWPCEVFRWLITWKAWSKEQWLQRLDRSVVWLSLVMYSCTCLATCMWCLAYWSLISVQSVTCVLQHVCGWICRAMWLHVLVYSLNSIMHCTGESQCVYAGCCQEQHLAHKNFASEF